MKKLILLTLVFISAVDSYKVMAMHENIQENQEDWAPTARRQRHKRNMALLEQRVGFYRPDFLGSANIIHPARETSDTSEQASTSQSE